MGNKGAILSSLVAPITVFLYIVSVTSSKAQETESISCQVLPLKDVVLQGSHTCHVDNHIESMEEYRWDQGHGCTRVEGRSKAMNETTLSDLLEALKARKNSLNVSTLALLYHASWCPFSREMIPIFNQLAELNPSIKHVTIEEKSIKPSLLSRFGVHSFPALYIQNRTTRIRYFGSRTLEDLQKFYSNVTEGSSNSLIERDWTSESGKSKSSEKCPYEWAKHPEQILQENGCLIFATIFVALRMVVWIIPRTLNAIKSTRAAGGRASQS